MLLIFEFGPAGCPAEGGVGGRVSGGLKGGTVSAIQYCLRCNTVVPGLQLSPGCGQYNLHCLQCCSYSTILYLQYNAIKPLLGDFRISRFLDSEVSLLSVPHLEFLPSRAPPPPTGPLQGTPTWGGPYFSRKSRHSRKKHNFRED